MNTKSPAVQFDGVTCRIGKRTVLSEVDLVVQRGEITGILGPNGAGKTTLLNTIVGLRMPSGGNVTVLGETSQSRSAAVRSRIGVVFQETALYDDLSAVENLRFAASLYQVREPEQRIKKVIELLDLTGRARDAVRTLSGGTRRRVTIARALLHEPELLIIDEPTLGVDVEARHSIWSHLRVLRSQGTTVVAATNYLDEASALCDTVVVLREGRVLISEAPDVLVARAGCCLDVDCDAAEAKVIVNVLTSERGVLRIASTETGLSIFLGSSIHPDLVVRRILDLTTIQGFRVRGADLAEVFQAVAEVAA